MTRRTLLLGGAALAHAEKTPVKTDLWKDGEGGYKLYRIPGVVFTSKGALLAYCEGRKSGGSDWGRIDIPLNRNGETIRMPQVEGPLSKNPVALARNLAQPDAITYNNPVAIADRNGRVHFLFCLEYMRAFYTSSGDDGRTWSKPVEITACFDGFRPEYPWRVIATGPGHGIQLRNGRLIVPIWMSTGTGGNGHRPSLAATIYSDDHGQTWKRGAIALPNTEEQANPSETVAAELTDGRVMLNARSESKARRRLVTISKDGASGWSEPRFQQELIEPVCFGSIVRAEKALVFANPDDPKLRRNLTIRLSKDNGQTWPVKRVLDTGWAGYSDLAARGREVVCLYERGAAGEDHFKTHALTLARFPLSWIR